MPGLIKVKRLQNVRQGSGPQPRMNPAEVGLVANTVEKLLDERLAQKKAAGNAGDQVIEEITEWR